MEAPVRISPAAPEYKSQDFNFLLEEGLAVVRQTAPDTWTDHNLHDPGVTLLEALCYAVTEIGLRTGMDMRDLLASGQSFAPQEFFTAAQALPGAPVAAIDFQKVLLDHPLVRNARVTTLADLPKARFSVLLEFSEDALNTNTFSLVVAPAALSGTYQVDLALPYWDETDVIALREDVQILSIAFDGPPGNPWQPLDGSTIQFARINLGYQPPAGPAGNLQLWVVAQVVSPLDNPLVELPEILDEAATALLTLGDNSPADQTLLKRYNRWVTEAHTATHTVRRYLRNYRNLCEDFVEFKAVRLQEVAFSATLEVSAEVDVEALLSDIFLAVDQHISPPVVLRSLAELQAAGDDPSAIFDGPLLDNGFLKSDALAAAQPMAKVFASDVLRIIFQQRNAARTDVQTREDLSSRGIIAVRNLSLSNWLDNHGITTEARDCLQLVDSNRHVPRLSPGKCRVVFYRNDIEIQYDPLRAIELFAERKAATLVGIEPGSADIPLPLGEAYPIQDYYPVQNDLPLVYGVGEAGLPEHASPTRKAQARQLKGYLFFFEQLLAGQLAQLARVNALFSADPLVATTVFQQPLYHLPDVADLFRSFDPATTSWALFQADAGNPYQTALQQAAEQEDQFLNRRNRFLDHLLARLGEDLQDLAAITYRIASDVPGAPGMTLPQLLAAQQQRRRAAARQLILDKSAFYYDLPALNRDRLQSFGNLLWRFATTVQFQQNPAGHSWQILDFAGVAVLESAQAAATAAQAQRDAAAALVLATATTHYFVVVLGGGQRRLELRATPGGAVLAQSIATYNSNPLALDARNAMRQSLLQKWVEFGLTPLEWRLYHLLGIRLKQRRQLLWSLNEYFEIFDEPDADAIIEKRFRLWELPGAGGDVLLESVNNYPGPDDATATADAVSAIRDVTDSGIFPDNYVLEQPAPNTFQVALNTTEGILIARSPATFSDVGSARAELHRIRLHLYRFFSQEGFYLIEHFLLYPLAGADPLGIPEAGADPYSFQLTFVFPSGYERDFTDPNAPVAPVQPARFRDAEFRRYAERMIRKSCPAHLLPRVLWVDRALPGSTPTGEEPCFDVFEERYRLWLAARLTDDVQNSTLEPLRAELARTLSAIYFDQSA